MRDGQRRLYTLNAVQTNDQGEFSLFWLPPGEYYVSAVPEDPLAAERDVQRVASGHRRTSFGCDAPGDHAKESARWIVHRGSL